MQFPISIQIDNEEELGLIQNAFSLKINENKNRISHLSEEVKKLQVINAGFEKKLTELSNQEPPKPRNARKVKIQDTTISDSPVPTTLTGLTMVKQAQLALKNLGKPSSTRDMLLWLLTVDPTVLDRNDKTFDKYQKAMAATLVQKVNAGKIFTSIRDAASGYILYSLIEWGKPE